ncbi:hypothetical protein HYU92_01520 [Candidatus Curtissbacteria bacterium]|nr:hypothetical protein [Candidatus Curtissbacteria bacterium]
MKNVEKIDPRVKDVLVLLAAGTFLAASVIFPGLPLVVKPFLEDKYEKDLKKWQKFNQWRLRALLKKLERGKLVEIVLSSGEQVVRITENGKRKVLKFDLENIKLDQKWDGKWRLIVYDIPSTNKRERDFFRLLLKKMKFLSLQKSVYLTPYRCENEIEYLRQVLGVADCIKVLKVAQIENDFVYRQYFGI